LEWTAIAARLEIVGRKDKKTVGQLNGQIYSHCENGIE